MSRARCAFSLFTTLLLFSCGRISGAELDAFVKTEGTATFRTSCGAAFRAASDSLAIDGYRIAIAQGHRGLIITAPKHVESYAYGSKTSATVVDASVALEVTARSSGGRCTIAVQPKAYINNTEEHGFSWPPRYLSERVFDPFFRNVARLLKTPALKPNGTQSSSDS